MKFTLKALRINKGLSQDEASRLIGVSTDTLSNYERGITYPDVPIIKNIEEVYGIEYKDIIFLP
ncbi:MAG: helix-turn-helix transcriptional regulator [Clostridia bacterium]|nr:helix-turn-helix transcriptional regulator [Clostridia bacterium]